MVYCDLLIGLGNCKVFDEQFGQVLFCVGFGGSELVLLYLDLDCFKEVNDCFGYDIGDVFFRIVVEWVCSILWQLDKVYCLGGDEFVVFFEDSQENNLQCFVECLLVVLV